MPVNRQTVRELSRTTLYNITSSGQAWRAFLDAAARLYKYSFPEQVLIYAQEPEATACAAKEVWYTRMKRSLRPDAQAIALPDPHSHFGRLKYVFDVRETQPLPGAPEFRQWSLPFEALERVTDRLGQEYGISREPVVADRVYALVMNAPRELYPMQLTAMLRAADAEGRWSGQDDAALARQFHQLVADSAAYMVGVRVGIGTGAVTSDALESITRFNSSGLAALAGTYASRLAASVLRDVERAARENDRLAFPARGVQNEGREEFSHAAEAAKEVQDNDIYNTERSALPGPDAGGTGGSTGQIRPAAPPIPGEKRPRPAEHPAAGGRAEQPSGADRPSGARAGGADDGASGTAHKAAGQTDGPAWLGRDDEQPAPAGGGNGDGADLRQLSLFPAEEEIQETGRSGTERPVSLSPDEIDDILRCDREYKKGCKKQDDYFFGKTIDKVRTGGIIAFITSSGTLDKASGNVRRYIAQRCELIGAVRLPSDTFRQSAGTEVTSDILFLQKRERMADRDEPWLHVGKTGDGVPINQYFAEHPEMVLGDMVMESGPFGPRSVCRPRPGQDLGAALHAALEGLDARLPAALPLEQAEQEIEMLPADPDVRNYSFTEVDGRLYFRENSVMRAVKLDGANTRRVRELIALRGQTRRLMQVQLDGCGDAAVQLEQDRLNRLYDNFVRRYGRINSRGNAGVFRDDSGYFLLCALEVFDDEGNFKCKSDMFTK